MLEKRFRLKGDDPDGFDVDMRIDPSWSTQKRRLLVIMQSVDGADLEAGYLCSTPAAINAIKHARSIARKYEPNLPDFGFAVTNFNARRHLHLKGQARDAAESEFRTRQLQLIEKLNPTHILFSGDLNKMWPVKHSNMKNGWVHRIEGRSVTSTVDFGRLMEKVGAHANLLGFWCRHLANLMIGRQPHDLSNVKARPVYIDTMDKFHKVMALFDSSARCGVDTETKNLSVTANAIYTIQFAFDTKPDRGYVIPIDHPHEDNPFSKKERRIIKAELAQRFAAETGPELITMNGMFDLRILRQCLNLDIIFLPVWEIMAGEHDLDENISSLASIGIKAGGLAAIFCSYGNDFYFADDTKFSKAERSTTGNISPSDPDFLNYAAMDAQSILHISDAQVARASKFDINGKNYGPIFERHVRYQMGDTAHVLSHLRQDGSLINKKYLRQLMGPDSKLAKAISDLNEEFKAFPEVVEANKQLLAESGFKTKSLFGGSDSSQWIFSFNKSAHKLKLFIDICKLKAISKTETGQDKIDKEFVSHYKDRSYLVAKFGEYQAATKLLSTYIKGWYKQLTREIDGATDDHLRADYLFFDVDTGRLASRGPNLQNIPARGPLSKIIKEMFITRDGHLLIRFDYSAHEVRGWSIAAGDTVLALAFKAGQLLRQQWVKSVTAEVHKTVKLKGWKLPLSKEQMAELKADRKLTAVAEAMLKCSGIATDLKTKGDIHLANVKRFFGKWVEKTDPLREAVKAVVFGVLYGKSAETLGNDTKRNDLDAVKAKINAAYKAKDKKALAAAEAEFEHILAEDRSEVAQEIIDKMFAEFQQGDKWVKRMQKMATEKFYVFSPIGRVRHLFAAMTEVRQIVSRQVRRGMNAPIQGLASEIAVKASRRVMVSYYKDQARICKMMSVDKQPIKFNRIVHDALYFTVPYDMVIPFIHIMQYEATYGVAQAYEREFGLKFTVEPEIEMEIGTKDTNSTKLDWSIPNMLDIISQSVKDGIEAELLTESYDEIMGRILAPWRNKECLKYLDDTYPILGVHLKKEIRDAAKQAH